MIVVVVHELYCVNLFRVLGSSKEIKEIKEPPRSRRYSNPVSLRRSNSQSESGKSCKPVIKTYPGPKQLSFSPEDADGIWDRFSLKESPKEDFFCDECNVHFHRKYHWQRHLLTKKHDRKTFHPCSQCDREFKRKASLTRHLKGAHAEDRPYACRDCDRRFTDRDDLKVHLHSHSGAKRYPCSKCSRSFSLKSSLKTHLSKKHKSKRKHSFYCNVCKKRYCDEQSLQRHNRLHNGEKPFACYVCNKRFSRREVLKTHLKVHRISAK